MEYFYIVIFLVGVLYTFVSLIVSGISGAIHSGGDFGTHVDGHLGHGHADTGHLGHVGGHTADGSHVGNVDGHQGHSASNSESPGFSHSLVSWFALFLNPLVAVSFFTVFGGMGIMGVRFFKWNSIIIFVVALASGIIVSAILYNFVAKPIYRSENTTDVPRDRLVGTAAEVTTDIMENGFGTIKYTVNSIMYTAPAKHIDEKAVKQGEKVFICKISDNTFYIESINIS